MSEARASLLAWGLFAVALALGASALALLEAAPDAYVAAEGDSSASSIVFLLVFLTFSGTGALVASRRPENAIGWLFVAVGVVGTSLGFTEGWPAYGLSHADGPLPGVIAAAWLQGALGGVLLPLLVLMLLLFPDGGLPGRRWRALLWLTGAETVVILVSSTLKPGALEGASSVRNPLGIESAAEILAWLEPAAYVIAPVLLIAAAASLVVRFRRAGGRERQQLKWFASGATVMAVLWGAVLVSSSTASLRDDPQLTAVSDVLVAIAFIALPVSAGVAILRHQLYDIDRIINRALVYGALTLGLAATYFGGVVLLGQLLRPLTEGSELAVAGSTLAVAALFRPLRGWVQAAVDRRFYRRRYDAARTLTAFSMRLREEVELETLSGGLRAAVQETLQPAHVSLWLREPRADGAGR